MIEDKKILVEIRNLKKYFPLTGGFLFRPLSWVRAVDGIDLKVYRGETLSLVGESGCGKTTLGRLILRLYKPTEGEVLFEGRDISAASRKRLRHIRKDMQVIFQDPFSSLDPRKTVGTIIREPLVIHRIGDKHERREKVLELMEVVGLRPEHYNRYPHEFSGGQRQRIGIARSLALHPKLIVCDEPVSALDVSIQAQVINLLEELQKRYRLTYLFIAHDLNVVQHVSDRVAVMYLGRIVELAKSASLYREPFHPYSEALLSASPVPDPDAVLQRIVLQGEVPSPVAPPPGCHFNTRCSYAEDQCRKEPAPTLLEVIPGRWARCWRVHEIRRLSWH